MNGLQILFAALETVVNHDIEISLIPCIRSAFEFSVDYFIALLLKQQVGDDTLMTTGS